MSSRGLNWASYKDDFLKRRLEGRMHLRGLPSYLDYAHYLDKNPSEFDDLLDALTINVSEFFRDPSVWHSLQKEFLPSAIRNKIETGERKLRIWSAGCADGEEPYTLALVVLETLSYNRGNFQVEIIGTDLDLASLDRARKGIYPPQRLRLVSKSILQRYFTPCDGGNFMLSEDVRKLVTFMLHDLSMPQPGSRFDVISCRNVIIYFSKELQQTLFRSFWNALVPGGYLILGKVESILGESSKLFRCVDLPERIYRKY
jgi:chemotaxis protein methyltransferase CheR